MSKKIISEITNRDAFFHLLGHNPGLIILKLGGDRDLKMILKECSLGVDKDVVLKMYEYATKEKFSPFIVDLESTDKDHKFRKGFNDYLKVSDF